MSGNIPETGRTTRITIRLVILQILVVSLLLTLGGRLWYLQIRNGQQYDQKAASNHIQQVVTPAVRGQILDDRGVPLADNETKLVVSASRTDLLKQADDGKAVLDRLAGVLGMKPEEVSDKVRLCDSATPKPCWNGSPYQPIPITDSATTQQALQIMERREDFPGITAEPTAVRRYAAPFKANAAQVLGYLGPVTDDEVSASEKTDTPLLRSDQIGRSGLESVYDKQMRGTAGVTRYEVDNLGRVIGKAGDTPAEPGSNLVTSIDARVQAVTEKELNDAMVAARKTYDTVSHQNYKADSGAAVVMDNRTGQIIAMASLPTYDPNEWVGGISSKAYNTLMDKKSDFPLLNRAIQGQSAPGSTFKVVSTSAAINAGYPPDGNYPCTSSMMIGDREFKNFENESFGDISLGRALEVSCDTVFYGIAYNEWQKDGGTNPKKPKDWFFKTAHQFGLGAKTGVDLPGEVTGRVPDRKWASDYNDMMQGYWCRTAAAHKNDKKKSFEVQISIEKCADHNVIRAGDSVNYAIGQGDTLVTPVQMARVYAALANGGTLYQPTIGKAVISADGKTVTPIKPKVSGKLPDTKATLKYIDKALAGVVTEGTADWKFGGWPQDKIPLHAKTGTAEVEGKQTTSWFDTYTKDYTIVMTISQGGTGSGASGEAVRRIYEAMYGITKDSGTIDPKKGIMPKPVTALPKISADGVATAASYTLPAGDDLFAPAPGGSHTAGGATQVLAALAPGRPEKLLLGRRYWS
ncbi:penicillin-binding protein 2 [Actinacidiphila bryophytorum]|uniref:Penicillin-binding protein 2 n=1 Tax=Actinacidiphila bryophytorum TaxID=1436133 RepID=A0A9W4GZA7_9ACTN|nr:penicillin-binding protein 2 [Actinacidiphila bryophytorum]MBM9434513.1 penicillin-binding protein 2 [Actinacidiphila bryophytorum]MBN6546562.1 penicillin-binding protein 2 [Actinacidiphila bryophytorum]CAG7626900.1 Penicillin-binding protein 2 [Actinacidiphila bryophytorum]